MYEEKINAYFDTPERRAELVEATSRLVCVRSVWGGSLPGMPFGLGSATALVEGLKLVEELGFVARNYDNYVGTADLNDKEAILHILCHLDVVGEGIDWTVTEPYVPKEMDGMFHDRGIDDDKDPVAAILLAVKIVKELGVLLRHDARLLVGAGEKSGPNGIAYCYAREPYAPHAFSPDAESPLINIEKGSYKPVLTKPWPAETVTPQTTESHDGFRISVLSPEAECLVAGLSADAARSYYGRAVAKTGVRYGLREEGDSLYILCRGKNAHASLPEESISAITSLLHLLCPLPLAKVGSTAALCALSALSPHGDCVDKALGTTQFDKLFKALAPAFPLLTVTGTGPEGQFDSQVPVYANDESCHAAAEASFSKFGFPVSGEMDAPHRASTDSPLVEALLKCYGQYTDYKGECPAIGGGTYVHDIPGDVAFGCCMPDFNGNIHGIGEYTYITGQLTAARVFTQAIIDLCG